MTKSTALVQASTDKTIPPYDPQVELEPNYCCRARNVARAKYCRARSGFGTDHVGQGRCKFHGGRSQNADAMKHGQYAKIITPRLAARVAANLVDPKPLDMLPTLAKAKAILDDAIEEYGKAASGTEGLEQLLRGVDTISKVSYRIEQIRAHGTVSVDRLRLFLLALDRAIELHVLDQHVREKLRMEIHGIRV